VTFGDTIKVEKQPRRYGMKILIVEDNLQNLKLFRVLIESAGYECLVAIDGEAGIEIACREIPDLILMDIQMPRMDGITALHKLRREDCTKEIPVIALTSYAMKGDRERFLGEGFDDYLEKPIDKNRFMGMIRKYE